MADPFVGEIRAFAFQYVPDTGWVPCDGRLLICQQQTSLYSLIGNLYGGDSKNGTFAVPNLQGQAPVGVGTGPGLTPRVLATGFGTASVTLDITELPNHDHQAIGYTTPVANLIKSATSSTYLSRTAAQFDFSSQTAGNVNMSPVMIGATGGNQPHENRQPYLPLIYCIATEGVYPTPAS